MREEESIGEIIHPLHSVLVDNRRLSRFIICQATESSRQGHEWMETGEEVTQGVP